MKKLILPLLLLLLVFSGCSEETTSALATTAAGVAEEAITTVVEKIDWEELKSYAADGYNALVEKYPSLAGDSVKDFLKDNGLKLINKYLDSSDAEMQENARKLGEIIKILNPELTDEVTAALG